MSRWRVQVRPKWSKTLWADMVGSSPTRAAAEARAKEHSRRTGERTRVVSDDGEWEST